MRSRVGKSRSAAVKAVRDHLPIVLALAIGIITFGAPQAAHAQTAPAAPVRESIDANGVDLFNGNVPRTTYCAM